MKRGYGSKNTPLLECVNRRISKWRVRWDMKPYINEEGEEQGVSFKEEEFLHKPSMEEIKNVVLDWYNKEIDDKIKTGFYFESTPVWLSTENQFNYKAAYDLAVQTGGASLPVTFKLGTTDAPVYRVFDSLDDLALFYSSALKFVNDTLSEGWLIKDGIDFSVYRIEDEVE